MGGRRRIQGHQRHDPLDLLVVGAHGHRLVRDLLFGQMVDRVRHGLEIPIFIARPERASTSAAAAPPALAPEADSAG